MIGLLALASPGPSGPRPRTRRPPKSNAPGRRPPARAPRRAPVEPRLVGTVRVVAGLGMLISIVALVASLILGQARDPAFRLDISLVGLLLAGLLALIFGPDGGGSSGPSTGGSILERWMGRR